jgi:hypothetical protein
VDFFQQLLQVVVFLHLVAATGNGNPVTLLLPVW